MKDKPQTGLNHTQERVYVLAPAAEPHVGEDAGLTLTELLTGVWRRRWTVAIMALLGAVAGFGFAQLGGEQYEATSTLLIQPPQFASDLKPAALSVEAYETLLRADHTMNRVRQQLVEEGAFEPGMTLRDLRRMVSTTIPQAESQRVPVNLPMILVTTRAPEPQMAERISNTMAAIFAQMSRDVATRGQEGALQLIESQYPATLKRLESAVTTENGRRGQYARELQTLTRRWDQRILSYTAATEKLTSEYESETRRRILQFELDQRPTLLQAQLQSRKDRLVLMEEELEDVRLKLKSSEYALKEVQVLLKEQPEKIILDQALLPWWIAEVNQDPESIPEEVSLQTETPNPIFRNLMDKFVEARVEVETLRPRESDLETEIARVRKQVDDLGLQVMKVELEELRLADARRIGLEELKAERQKGLTELESARDLELGDFSRNRDLVLAAATREKDTAEATFKLMAERYESARLAKSEQEPDVKIGALALAPESPVARGTLLKTSVGLVAAFMLAFFGALIAEALSAPREQREYGDLSAGQLKARAGTRLAES